jgi:hypothetical protein
MDSSFLEPENNLVLLLEDIMIGHEPREGEATYSTNFP